MKEERFTPAEVVTALVESGGVQTDAARILKCHRNTIGRYIREHDDIRLAYEDIIESEVDEAENLLVDYWKGNVAEASERTRFEALRYYLRTKGRSRGYGDRQQIDVNNREPVARAREALKELATDDLVKHYRDITEGRLE